MQNIMQEIKAFARPHSMDRINDPLESSPGAPAVMGSKVRGYL